MANRPRRGRCRQNRHRYGCARSSSLGAATGTMRYCRASSAQTTRRMAPPLPAASMPSNTTTAERWWNSVRARQQRQPGMACLDARGDRPCATAPGCNRARTAPCARRRPAVRRRCGRRQRRARQPPGCPPAACCSASRMARPDGQVAIVGVAAFHHGPRRRWPELVWRSACSDTLRNRSYCLNRAQSVSVMRQRVFGSACQCGQPLLLRLLRQMEPELQQQRAFVDQHALEPHDAFQRAGERVVADLAGDAVEDRVAVPGAEQDADAPLGRQGLPVAPHAGAFAFRFRHVAECRGQDVPRVHPFVQHVQRLALAGAIHAADDDQQREGGALQQLVLQHQQLRAQRRASCA